MTRRLDWEKAAQRDLMRDTRQPRALKPGRRGALPATQKQLAYLKSMGVVASVGLTRNQASAILDAKKKR